MCKSHALRTHKTAKARNKIVCSPNLVTKTFFRMSEGSHLKVKMSLAQWLLFISFFIVKQQNWNSINEMLNFYPFASIVLQSVKKSLKKDECFYTPLYTCIPNGNCMEDKIVSMFYLLTNYFKFLKKIWTM